ncbi:hypothetical protein [Maridesulfovibrio zosterae]|uniref:hypothetical protein n=1 Tax=Maridesulfovibrio zosterae TaxID=82171 RepID=UPI0003FF6EF4|nr:hypothetical protein [Maridesulfovibrio zosterae]
MSKNDDSLTELFDKEGNQIGVLISADLWAQIKPHIKQFIPSEAPKERPEPIKDWEILKEYWDFPYPVDTDVHCEHCGTRTENWETDTPRKFKLASCNLGGLVSFKCQQCNARIVKKHFKNEITVECTPYIDEKSKNMEARY